MADNVSQRAEVQAVLGRWRSYMARAELSQKAAARKLGCSASVLSQVLAGKYPGNVARLLEEMVRVMRRAGKRARRPKRPAYRETPTSQRIQDAILDAHVEGVIVVILGRTGVGKTTAAQDYCTNEPTALYLIGGPKAGPGAVIKRLAGMIDLKVRGATWDLWQQVAAKLRGSHRVLIIDEVDYIPEDTLQILRLIRDESEIGLVVLGTPAYLIKLHSRRSATIDQWLGRVAYTEILDGATREDIVRIAENLPLDEAAMDQLVECAGGETRRAVHILIGMQRQGDGYKPIHVRMAAAELMPNMETLRKRER